MAAELAKYDTDYMGDDEDEELETEEREFRAGPVEIRLTKVRHPENSEEDTISEEGKEAVGDDSNDAEASAAKSENEDEEE